MGIWRLGEKLERIEFSPIESEAKLEDTLVGDIRILSPGLLLIGRQVTTAFGKFIDILAMDADGNLVVVELKRNRTPREVVAQLLDYASWVQGLSYDQIAAIYKENHAKDFEGGFADKFGQSPPEKLNDSHELIVVSAELDPSTERIIGYLSNNHGVPINAVFFRYFKDGENEYLSRSWLVDPTAAETNVEKLTREKGGAKEAWNGRDFYVSFGGTTDRSWQDALRYGFISAGGGRWYTQTLYNLKQGHRVWVNLPGTGYVAVGDVTGTAQPLRDFNVEVDGKEVKLLDAPRDGYRRGEHLDDDDLTEHLVPIRWIKAVPEDQAYWEKGLFAKQHSACKLRNRFTLERLGRYFEVDD